MVRMLLKHSADVNKANDLHGNMTPLQFANNDRCYPPSRVWLGKKVIHKRFSCSTQHQYFSIYYVRPAGKRLSNYDRITELLIKSGADVNAQDASGSTVLHFAAYNGRFSFKCLKLMTQRHKYHFYRL